MANLQLLNRDDDEVDSFAIGGDEENEEPGGTLSSETFMRICNRLVHHFEESYDGAKRGDQRPAFSVADLVRVMTFMTGLKGFDKRPMEVTWVDPEWALGDEEETDPRQNIWA